MKRFLIIMLALVFVLSACNNNPNDGLIIIGPSATGNADRNEVEKVVGDVSTAFAGLENVNVDGENTVGDKTMTIKYTPIYEDSSVASSLSITVIDENAGKKIIGYSVSISIVSGEDTIAISYSTNASGEINSAVSVTLNSKAVSNADVSSLTSQVTTAIADDIVAELKTTLLESITTPKDGFALVRVFNRISWLFDAEGKPSTDTNGTIEWADGANSASINEGKTEITIPVKVTDLLYSVHNENNYKANGTVELVFTGSIGDEPNTSTFTSDSVAFKNLDVEITSVTDAFNPIELKADELKIGFASGSGAEFAVSDSSVTDLNNPTAITFDLSGFSGTNITLNGISTEIDSLS